jgi:hypothetical protein
MNMVDPSPIWQREKHAEMDATKETGDDGNEQPRWDAAVRGPVHF